MRRWSAVAIVVLLFLAGATVAFRSVHRHGFDCGSVVLPKDIEVNGPAGTNPRPCSAAHDADFATSLILFALSGLAVFPVRWSSRERSEPDVPTCENA
jgi:hypothetical protein